MHDIYRTWIDDRNSSVKYQTYKKCKNEVQNALSNVKDSWGTSRAAELQQAADKKDTNAFYGGLRKVYSQRDGGNSQVISVDSRTLQTDKEDILLRWREHCESVLNSNSDVDEDVIASISQRPAMPQFSRFPNFEEVKVVIKRILSGKVPGKDGIPPEICKYGGTKLIKNSWISIVIWKHGYCHNVSETLS